MNNLQQRSVLVSVSDGVASIALNRPDKLNAIDHALGVELYEAFVAMRDLAGVRAIVLRGNGPAFCAGDELGRATAADEARSLERGPIRHYASGPGRWTTTVSLMQRIPLPIIARVHGYAYGAGFNLALGADFRVMATDAKLAAPFIKRGLSTGTNQLQRYVGIGKALEITLLGEPIAAAAALQLGLVTAVADPGDLDDAVDDLARRLASGPTAAIGLTKDAVYCGWNEELEETFWRQGAAYSQGQDQHDRAEGLAAFVEKRAPRFIGQ